MYVIHKDKLHAFLDHIGRLVRDSFEAYGRNVAYPMATSTASEIGLRLQRASIQLAVRANNPEVTDQELFDSKQLVESQLLAGQSIGVITQKEFDRLVRELDNVMEKKTWH